MAPQNPDVTEVVAGALDKGHLLIHHRAIIPKPS
jgi:hypothetical protein